MRHELKMHPVYYEAVSNRSKTFEYRRNDRGFQKGDTVVLKEFDPNLSGFNSHCYSGNELTFLIGYVLPVSETHVVFSLLEQDVK